MKEITIMMIKSQTI